MTQITRALVILAPSMALGWAHPPRAIARPDILRVQASSCAGDRGSRVGTGFAWHSPQEVVTALHVVAGCQRITIYSERDQVTYRVNLTRLLSRADLAIVQVEGNVTFPPITETVARPAADLDLTAWGYGEGVPAMRDFRRLRVANGAATLRQNVPAEVASELARQGRQRLI